MKKAPPFWLVWNPDGHAPRYHHPNHADAVKEATRLAKRNPSHEFYVLEPTHRVVSNDVTIEQYDSDELPF